MSELPGSKDFAPHLHTVFTVETSAALELELIEVADNSNAQIEQGSVFFAGPLSPWLQQGSYTLLHPAMGPVSLFMGPKGPSEGRMIYEVIFSRLIAAGS